MPDRHDDPLRSRRRAGSESGDLPWASTRPESAPWNRPGQGADDVPAGAARAFDDHLESARMRTTQELGQLVRFIEDQVVARVEALTARITALEAELDADRHRDGG
ncbi:hypothetical protein FTX61_04195 [Nitriliruptoraceae bacterium ZYF776]|nr:hypothetical protein [Profundirhabdus halotolerans]